MASIEARLRALEKSIGTSEPRHVIVWWGPHLTESWIERGPDGSIDFHVKTPAWGDDDPGRVPPHGMVPTKSVEPQPCNGIDPLRYLTDQMRAALRPSDTIVTAESANNPRDAHLQFDRPSWKRRPFRRLADGAFELQGEDGEWRRHDR